MTGKPITAEVLNTLMSDLFKEGYGSSMTDDPKRTGITWAQFSHLYSPFYTFQYATGISAAHALATKVLANEPNAAHNYLKFLSSGSAIDPLDALRIAGVDMTSGKAVEETFGVLSSLIDQLESLL